MNRILALPAAVFAAILLLAVPNSSAENALPSPQKIAEHMRASFGLSPLWKVSVSELTVAPLPGYRSGTLSIEAPPHGGQDQPFLVSEDGRWYFIGAAYPVVDSDMDGFKKLGPAKDAPPPPDLMLSADGRFAILGTPQNLSVDPDAEHRSKMKLSGAVSHGPEDAPLTLVEYSDLQCPHCKRAHDILTEKLPSYKGKVRRVFKNYPLAGPHPWAYRAALALACANGIEPKKAFTFKSAIFKAQESITEPNSKEKLLGFAKDAGLPEKRFSECLEKENFKAAVEADIAEGNALDIRGTPAIFVNGRRVRGYEWAEVEAVLNAMAGGGK